MNLGREKEIKKERERKKERQKERRMNLGIEKGDNMHYINREIDAIALNKRGSQGETRDREIGRDKRQGEGQIESEADGYRQKGTERDDRVKDTRTESEVQEFHTRRIKKINYYYHMYLHQPCSMLNQNLLI